MALILEVRHRRGAVEWRALDDVPVTIGRGYANDVILDDLYADAQHARITRDATGVSVLEDLGSVNGTVVRGERIMTPCAIAPGDEIRLGRTRCYVRDRDERMPAALRDTRTEMPRAAAMLLSTRGSATLALVLLVVGGMNAYIGSSERSARSTAIAAVLAVAMIVFAWSGAWALATRGPERRYNLMAHIGVASAAALCFTLQGMAQEWFGFLFPGAPFWSVLFVALMLGTVGLAIVGHLSVTGTVPFRTRWIAGGSVAGVFLLFIVLGSLIQNEKFSDVPQFQSYMKALPPRFVPSMTVRAFVAAAEDAKREADEANTK